MLPSSAFKTYSVRRQRDVSIPAACEQVNCQAWRHGWESTVDESTELGRRQAAYIRGQSRRTFREQRTAAGLTVFTFASGQRCFANHHTVPETYLVRRGGTGTPARIHSKPSDWVEDFTEHQQQVAADRERG